MLSTTILYRQYQKKKKKQQQESRNSSIFSELKSDDAVYPTNRTKSVAQYHKPRLYSLTKRKRSSYDSDSDARGSRKSLYSTTNSPIQGSLRPKRSSAFTLSLPPACQKSTHLLADIQLTLQALEYGILPEVSSQNPEYALEYVASGDGLLGCAEEDELLRELSGASCEEDSGEEEVVEEAMVAPLIPRKSSLRQLRRV